MSRQILDVVMLKLFCHNTKLNKRRRDLVDAYYKAKIAVVEEGRGDGRNKYVSVVLCDRLL